MRIVYEPRKPDYHWHAHAHTKSTSKKKEGNNDDDDKIESGRYIWFHNDKLDQ